MTDYSIYRFPIAHNPKDHIIYADDPALEVPEYRIPLMDARAWTQATGKKGVGSDSAGGALQSDPLELSDIFFNNGSRPEYNFEDISKTYLSRIHEAKSIPDRRKARDAAAAVITSLDFADFQNTIILGENLESQLVKEGVLKGLFQEIPTPNLSGKWASMDSDIRWTRNIPEGKSPEPSGGVGSVVSISVPKHGGSVAITQRAQDVINGDNPFARLVGILQRKRLEDENEMTAIEVESNTAHSITGVDFGSRSGTPPVSQTNPADKIFEIEDTFEGLKAPWTLFISRGKAYWELIQNDLVRGVNNPLPSQGTVQDQITSFPLADGVRWARDRKVTSVTAGWALNEIAIKEFRGATRTYTVANPDTETTRYVVKAHFLVETVEPTLVYTVTGITA